MSQRVVVTGGLGFVGSSLVERLVATGCEVTIVDDLSRGSLANVSCADDIHTIVVDIRERACLERALDLEGVDAVVHLAATHFLPDCDRDPQGAIVNNVLGTENILSLCADAGVSRVIAASSMAVYPISDHAVKETDGVGPYDIYGETKVMNEMQLQRWSRGDERRSAVALRLSNVYGPRETNPHVIPEIMRQLATQSTELALGNTAPFRDYVHARDVAAAVAALVSAELPTGYEVFNLGSGEEHSVDEVIQVLTTYLDRPFDVTRDPARVRPTDRMHLLPDISKILAATCWAPTVRFEDGLRDLCRDYGLAALTATVHAGAV
jgi:UDP-glucose 4-epimerase